MTVELFWFQLLEKAVAFSKCLAYGQLQSVVQKLLMNTFENGGYFCDVDNEDWWLNAQCYCRTKVIHKYFVKQNNKKTIILFFINFY